MHSNTHKMQDTIYDLQAKSMHEELAQVIIQKQKSTHALALSLANDEKLAISIVNNNIPQNYYADLISKLKNDTLYKNVWIQLLNKDGISIYRSWSNLRGDQLLKIRDDVKEVITTKQPIHSISVGKFDLSIKSMIPVFKENQFIGVLEIITHFNSIANSLKASHIESVILVKKEYKQKLIHPFTKMFLGDNYIANLNAPSDLIAYLKEHHPQNYFNNSHKIENGYLIVSYPLKDNLHKEIAYFIMFKKLSDINSIDLQYFTFKWIALFALFSIVVLFILSNIILIKNRTQKFYYKNILDSSSNIMIVNDGKRIIDANKTFFLYFYKYDSLEKFLEKHQCICDFFIQEEGYLHSYMGNVYWTEYIIKYDKKVHKVKINYYDTISYFRVTVSLILKEKKHYSIVFSDITKEEEYQKELLYLSTKDALTNTYNRRFFNEKIDEELARALRYDTALSLIMLDIDFFKHINDTYGHNVGDDILTEYSNFIAKTLRQTDTFCRIGGEEFMIILPHTSVNEAQSLAQKLCDGVENHRVITPITMSFGVVQYEKNDSEESLLKRVDDALYKAKESGRNCVVVG